MLFERAYFVLSNCAYGSLYLKHCLAINVAGRDHMGRDINITSGE